MGSSKLYRRPKRHHVASRRDTRGAAGNRTERSDYWAGDRIVEAVLIGQRQRKVLGHLPGCAGVDLMLDHERRRHIDARLRAANGVLVPAVAQTQGDVF